MMRLLVLLIVLIPAAEIGIFIYSGKTIGVLPTVLLIVLTSVLGAWLAKKQGIETLRKAREEISYGNIPGDAILDGLCILSGAILLLTPGFLSDIAGFILLTPFTRKWVKPVLIRIIRRRMHKNRYTIIR
ncbi:FxsA family protein [Metabacillus sp. RGM 3146]|uniref:FxsA family protein n=1 Tax=Metabacillus sp. RGM 3146 TaxID=3401092 RepID=UPI003B9D74D5